MSTQENVVLNLQDEIEKWLMSRGHNHHGVVDIYLGVNEKVTGKYPLKIVDLLDVMVEAGKLKKSYLVEYHGIGIQHFDRKEDIPTQMENVYARDWEEDTFPIDDADILVKYGHVDWKGETEEEKFWSDPPYVYRPEHFDYVKENYEGGMVLVWRVRWWKPCDWAALKPGDIWKSSLRDPPSEELLEESKKVKEECESSP